MKNPGDSKSSLRLLQLLPGLALLLATHQAPAQCDPPPSGIVAWWPGEGNANDLVGSNNGTLVAE
jgi:hypothetical protein